MTPKFEPLSDHDRRAFSCGVDQLDRYLWTLQATQDARRKVAAPFVAVDRARQIVGYYTLSAYGVQPTELPAEVIRKLPKYPLLPATLLGRLAIHREHRGQGLGALLLMDALYRSWKNAEEVASVAVVAEAIDDEAERFYLHHEFIPLTNSPRLFLAMKTIGRLFR